MNQSISRKNDESRGFCRYPPPRRSPETDAAGLLKTFQDDQKKAMERDMDLPGSRAKVREFFNKAVTPKSNEWYCYRHFLSNEFKLEENLAQKLDAYDPVPSGDAYTKEMAVCRLKHLRRFALRRYAFDLSGKIESRLEKYGESQWWLKKDRLLLPRIPLALAVGYGVVLGSIREWLNVLGRNHWFALGASLFCLAITSSLIYLNVRESAGRRNNVGVRAKRVIVWCLLWSAFFLGTGRLLVRNTPFERDFDWGVGACLGSAALLVAIVAQFFFAKAGSIADPL